jgi:mono/diheme cytochrome c family protein
MGFLACSQQEARREAQDSPTSPEKKSIKVQKSAGEKIFLANCASCHNKDATDLIGPGMAGITKRRKKEWIIAFIKNPQALIASGDKEAVALFNKYNKAIMLSFMFPKEEMEALYEYLETL